MFFGDASLGGPQSAMPRLVVEIGRTYHKVEYGNTKVGSAVVMISLWDGVLHF